MATRRCIARCTRRPTRTTAAPAATAWPRRCRTRRRCGALARATTWRPRAVGRRRRTPCARPRRHTLARWRPWRAASWPSLPGRLASTTTSGLRSLPSGTHRPCAPSTIPLWTRISSPASCAPRSTQTTVPSPSSARAGPASRCAPVPAPGWTFQTCPSRTLSSTWETSWRAGPTAAGCPRRTGWSSRWAGPAGRRAGPAAWLWRARRWPTSTTWTWTRASRRSPRASPQTAPLGTRPSRLGTTSWQSTRRRRRGESSTFTRTTVRVALEPCARG
mmetsp:Transcript_2315/g.7644  ORF Transcript_2315/g.7644 Transcript_2315/m.7644 type:complete len:275 (+) Transcript_2315:221-1045(+)